MENKSFKILIVSHLYPPFSLGGYEMRCSQMAKALKDRGYEVCVVTSSYGGGNPQKKPEFIEGIKVYRALHDYGYTHITSTRWERIKRLHQQYDDMLSFSRIAEEFSPDIINWWHLGGLCKGILAYPTHRGIPDVHWIEDTWMNSLWDDERGDSFGWDRFWQGRWGPKFQWPLFRFPAKILRGLAQKKGISFSFKNLKSDFACFSCEFQREINAKKRIQFKDSSVIYGGSKVDKFYCQRDWTYVLSRENPVRLLYIAAITESRKLDILLEALEKMEENHRKKFSLTVVGKPPVKECEAYYNNMQEKVKRGSLSKNIIFLGQRPYNELTKIYKNHDLLIFTSARPEGIPNAVLEAMLSGLCVLSTGVGGTGDIAFVAEQPLFLLNNPEHLRKMLLRFEEDREWLVECAQKNQKSATEKFSFSSMVGQFENVLQKLASVC